MLKTTSKIKFIPYLFLFINKFAPVQPEFVFVRNNTKPLELPPHDPTNEYVININSTNLRIDHHKKGTKRTIEEYNLILKALIDNHDPRLRPHLSQTNISDIVYIDLEFLSLGPISDITETFQVSLFFRTRFYDPRLQFGRDPSIHTHKSKYFSGENPNHHTNVTNLRNDEDIIYKWSNLNLTSKAVPKFWQPDTYFVNEVSSHMHAITTPNQLLRIYPNGWVLVSSRITIKAKCSMTLDIFPFDVQTCKLIFGSFSYDITNVNYEWMNSKIVKIFDGKKSFDKAYTEKNKTYSPISASKMMNSLVEYKLINLAYASQIRKTVAGNYSELVVCFTVQRHLGYYIAQTYLPCGLIVFISQISFWINKEATPARMIFGSNAILSLTMQSISLRNEVPQISKITALDFYMSHSG